MAEQTELRKLLVLKGPAIEAQGIVSLLREHFDVQITEQLEDALEAMRRTRFEAVLAETADFLPLERGVVTQQAAVILDTIGDGVCLAGPDGRLVWANRRLSGFGQAVLGPLREICAGGYEHFAAGPGSQSARGRRFSMMPPNGRSYEVICSPVRDRVGDLRQVVAVVIDVTSQRRQQLKLNAIDRAGRELVDLNQQNISQRSASERLGLLAERIIACSREVLDYEHFALLLLNDQTRQLEALVTGGLDADEDYSLLAGTEGNGICGYVAATGRSYICSDVRADGRYLPGLGEARSCLTVPLRLGDKIVGVLNLESRRLGAFGEEDRQFAEIFANYVALGMHILDILAWERHTAHTRASGSICADLSGPINDILTEAGEVREDYIGHDDLRRRLQAIIDRACDARRVIHACAESPGAAVAAGAGGQQDPILAGKRVLVADDEELMRQTIRDVLIARGCRVDVAADGAEASRMVARTAYDLVISDIKMPGANGYEVFAAAKAARSDARVILITGFGYDPHHSIVKANGEGLAAVLMKPFKAHKLLAECRAALSSGAQ